MSAQKQINIKPEKLLDWYDAYRRDLPWRAKPDQRPNPYHVWLSEIMLQQTTVTAVKPYFKRFIEIWPTVFDLAKADRDMVMEEWAGLGYYNRAKNLHKTAKVIANDHKGIFPEDIKTLKTLPGIGDYTANAIRSIAFDKRAVVVDGNVKRVMARLYGIEEPIKTQYKTIANLTDDIWPTQRHADFAQSLMDFGSMVCTPKSPSCHDCIYVDQCIAKAKGIAETLPNKGKKKPRPIKKTNAYIYVDEEAETVFLLQRPDGGILPNMLAPPMDDWLKQKSFPEQKTDQEHKILSDHVVHVFTHIELHVKCVLISVHNGNIKELPKGEWYPMNIKTKEKLPSLTRKILKHAGCF